MSKVSYSDAMKVAKQLRYKGNPTEFWMGMNVEMEHSGVVGGSLVQVGRIVMNHLDERKDYYTFGLKQKFFSRKEVGLK